MSKTRQSSDEDTRSFSYHAKNEICVRGVEEGAAELAAMTLAAGTISGGAAFYTTENLAAAQRIERIVEECFHLAADFACHESTRGAPVYTVRVLDGESLLTALGITDAAADAALPAQYLSSQRRRTAVVRGAFLAGGSVSNPAKNYHLEFVLLSEELARSISGILSTQGIRAKTIRRKEHFVLYLNEGDSIAALLALIGAHTSILNLENVRILKETRNNVNRAVNCETANINKTVNAALNQIHSIQVIEQEVGLKKLSASLQEAARVRLDYPEATLQELCELCGTTKSGMNHRLRKINEIARSLKGEEH